VSAQAVESVPLLSGREWKPAYETEDGDLIELFYNPALACAKSYDRMTGYAAGLAATRDDIGRNRPCAESSGGASSPPWNGDHWTPAPTR
jgi:hypothetical protein